MREYETWEVIKMLTENPKLRFKCVQSIGTGVENEYIAYVTSSEYINFTRYVEGNLCEEGLAHGIHKNIRINDKWTLVQEPVDFKVAMNSGKKIKPVGTIYYNSPLVYVKPKEWLKILFGTDTWLDYINGKWLIEEGES